MYLLFAGSIYYPSGGWEDYKGTFSTLEEAKEIGIKEESSEWGWWHIVYDGKIVDSGASK